MLEKLNGVLATSTTVNTSVLEAAVAFLSKSTVFAVAGPILTTASATFNMSTVDAELATNMPSKHRVSFTLAGILTTAELALEGSDDGLTWFNIAADGENIEYDTNGS